MYCETLGDKYITNIGYMGRWMQPRVFYIVLIFKDRRPVFDLASWHYFRTPSDWLNLAKIVELVAHSVPSSSEH